MTTRRPSYLNLIDNGELERRISILGRKLVSCTLCAHRCQVNRKDLERGFCRAPSTAVVSSACAHGGEEKPLSGTRGSGTVFFTFCNSRCLYCQNYDISQMADGNTLSDEQLANTFLRLQKRGCHNINLVSPAHFLVSILKALAIAANKGLEIPLVYNSNAYDSVEILQFLEGIVDIYLPDYKFHNSHKALYYTRMPDYPKTARAAIREMYRQVGKLKLNDQAIAERGVIVRHLILPENEAGTNKVLQWLSELDEEIHVNLMGQYYPAYHALYEEKIDRRITWQEYHSAAEFARKAGLKNVWTQEFFVSCSR